MAEIRWTDAQLAEAGIDKKRLKSLVLKLSRCAEQMQTMGLSIYGESGGGHLIHTSRPTHDRQYNADLGSVVAYVGSGFDGGGW